MVDTRLESRGRGLADGVRQIDAAGRRWYTHAFKQQVVAECLQPDASVSKVAVDHGLNPNLVRKWIANLERDSESEVKLLPVVATPEPLHEAPPVWRHVVEIPVGDAVILIGENASSEVIRTIVRALR